ncbi:MAG TPA: glycosyltransferase [Candidatus Binatia bacterium]|jgi:glycosyltransferase involved in cell wall biosynthesis|nr:glycosyltransferase [Candidatus Binatia bacterium]
MEQLKVLFLTNWYPTKEEPVKAVWVREYAKAVRFYDEVRVLHCAGSGLNLKRLWRMEQETDEKLREGIPIYRVWYRPFPLPHTSYFIYIWSVYQAFRQLVNQGFRPDIIHVHVYDAGGPAVLIGKLHRIPVVISEHFTSFPRRILGHLDIAKAWLAFRWANKVLPVSYALQKAIEHYGIHAHFQVIPNVVDTALFSPPSHLPKNMNPKRILFVGQLVPVKGLPYLLQALSHLGQKRQDWHLDIIGDGKARMEYEHSTVKLKLGDKVAFHGLKTKQEVAEFMRRADLLVVSSLAETFSVPAAEALATGTPILATRCGGPEEFVNTDVGLLVPPGDADILYQGLDYMLDNLHLYSRKRIAQYAKVRFSSELVGEKLHAVYQSLSAPRRAGSASR